MHYIPSRNLTNRTPRLIGPRQESSAAAGQGACGCVGLTPSWDQVFQVRQLPGTKVAETLYELKKKGGVVSCKRQSQS